MRKVLSSLVVLAVLVGMFVCLGAQAFAAPEDIAVFAVTDEQLSPELIARLQEQCSGSLVVDANGMAEGQSELGYNVVWRESDPMVMTETAYIWPGFAQIFGVGDALQPVLLVGVGAATTAEEVSAAIASVNPDGTEMTVAVGPVEAAEAVKNQVKVFLATGKDDGEITDLEGTKVIHVGKLDAPIAAVYVNKDGAVTGAENMPLPVSADPNVGTTEPEAGGDAGIGGMVGGLGGPIVSLATVSFDAGGAQGAMDAQSAAIGVGYPLPECGFTWEGYHFVGWQSSGDLVTYNAGDNYTVTGDVTFTAQWEQDAPVVTTFDVTFVPGDGANGTPVVVPVTSDALPAMIEQPADFVKEGFTFTGWLLNGEHYDVNEPYSVSEATTVYADWTPNEVAPQPVIYTVTYDLNGGTNADEAANPLTQQVDFTDIAPENRYFGVPSASWIIAPAGKVFSGWLCSLDGQTYLPTAADGTAAQVLLTGNVTFTAQWTDDGTQSGDTETETYAVSYSDGTNTYAVAEKVAAGGIFKTLDLAACGFTAPEGKAFDVWKCDFDGNIYAAGVDFTMPEHDVVFTAQWKDPVAPTYVITYKPGEGVSASDVQTTVNAGSNQLALCMFTAPEGKTFDRWEIGGQYFAAGAAYDVQADLTATATWKDLPKEGLAPGVVNGDTILWTRGGNVDPSVTFQNAQIDSVSVGGSELAAGTQYVLSNNNQTVSINRTYLDQLNQGEYSLNVGFSKDANGNSYNDFLTTISVTVPPQQSPDATGSNTLNLTEAQANWPREGNWYHDFESPVTNVEIYWGKDDAGNAKYNKAELNKEYTISGNRLYLLSALVNGQTNYGAWEPGTYSFRVTLQNNTIWTMSLKLVGAKPTTDPNQNNGGNTQNGGVPVTGDETPITLYIVILVVLILALAGVLIFVMKRRNAGGRGGRR